MALLVAGLLILGVVMALPRSQLSPRIQNAREKEGANKKMLWWKWMMPLLERVGLGSPTLENGLLDAMKCGS